MTKSLVVFALALIAGLSYGDVPDATSSLECLGNPTLERWATPIQANSVMDLQSYQGKVYLGTGDYDKNKGPIPIWAYDPVSNAFTNEFTAGTESVELLRSCSDGRLYVPATDPKDGDANCGSLFRRELNGSWRIFPYYTKEQLPSSGGYSRFTTHVYDAEVCQNHLFMCGYGAAMSDNDGMTWACVDNYIYLSRMSSLVRCGSELFCAIENDLFFSGTTDGSGTIEQNTDGFGRAYMLRWKEATGVFEFHTNKWANIAPGLTHRETALVWGPGNNVLNVATRLWHATPFGDRCLYVLGENYIQKDFTTPVSATGNVPSGTRPMMAASGYAADDGAGGRTLKADRIALPTGYWPIDFCTDGETAYLLAFAYNSADQNVRHGVWKSTDGVTFTQILSFDYQQVMMSMEYLNGYFYFGVAHKNAMIALGALKSGTSENAGSVYRIKWPVETDFPAPVNGVVTLTTPGTYAGDFPLGLTNLVVAASGRVIIAKAHEFYAGTVEVRSGSRLEAADFKALGGESAVVRVASGATLAVTAAKSGVLSSSASYFLPTVSLAGTGTDGQGAFMYLPSSTDGGKNPDRVIRTVKLSADATISVTTRWGIGQLDLSGHTLTRVGYVNWNSNWMFFNSTVTAGHIDNRAGTMTWQGADFQGTKGDSSITVSGGTLCIWGSVGHPVTVPVYLTGGTLQGGSGTDPLSNRLTSDVVITNTLPYASLIGNGNDKSLNFEGPVRSDALGTVLFNNPGTNIFSSALTVRDSVKWNVGTYLFKEPVTIATNLEAYGTGTTTFEKDLTVRGGRIAVKCPLHLKGTVSMPRGKDLTSSAGDVFFEGNAARTDFGGLVIGGSGRVTLAGGTLCPRMLRASNGGAAHGTFHNAGGAFTNSDDDVAYIGESAGSFGVLVQEKGATTTFGNSIHAGFATNSICFICQKGGVFTHRRYGYFHLGLRGHGFLWVTGGTNDSHFSKVNATRLKMSEEDGTSTLVVRGEGSLLQTDSLLAGNTSKPTTNTIAVAAGGTLRAHRFYSVAGRAAGSFSCVQLDGGTLAPSFFSGWGDAGTSMASFYERTFNRVTVHAGGVIFDTTGCVNDQGVETDVSVNALNFERPSGRGVGSIALPTDAAFKALKYKSPVPIVFEGPGFGATAYADFDYATGELTGVVVGSAGCDYDATSRAYVLAPTGNPAKYACAITLTDDNRPSGTFTKRGAEVGLTLYGTNDCSGVVVESGVLTAGTARALPQNVPVTVRAGATLRPYGSGAYVASALEGAGRIESAAVTLAENGIIYVTADEIFAAGATPLTVTSALTLGAGAKVVVRDPENLAKYADRPAVTILTAGALSGTGAPTLEPAVLASDWHVSKSGHALRLGFRRGLTVLVK